MTRQAQATESEHLASSALAALRDLAISRAAAVAEQTALFPNQIGSIAPKNFICAIGHAEGPVWLLVCTKTLNYRIARRVSDLLGRMTLAEKIAQMYSHWLILSPDGNHRVRTDTFAQTATGENLKEMLELGVGQITRPLGTHPVDPREGIRALNALQKFLVEETRLGIPALSHEECWVGLLAKGATLFPGALNYGSTWNPELIEAVGEEIRKEAKQVGCHQGLAPVLDVSRDVRWGRTEETMGEDPYLIGVLATRYVKGLQGEKRELLATLKHYVAHSFSEGARNHAPVHLGFKELNDIFMLPFEMAVKQANAGSVCPPIMTSTTSPVTPPAFY